MYPAACLLTQRHLDIQLARNPHRRPDGALRTGIGLCGDAKLFGGDGGVARRAVRAAESIGAP
jgi:hypothetical protein